MATRRKAQPKPVTVHITSGHESLTPDELRALQSYASWAQSNLHQLPGRATWKEALSRDWYHAGERTMWAPGARGCGDWCYLQRLRNAKGWEWLERQIGYDRIAHSQGMIDGLAWALEVAQYMKEEQQ